VEYHGPLNRRHPGPLTLTLGGVFVWFGLAGP
jgi:hypothetical protein